MRYINYLMLLVILPLSPGVFAATCTNEKDGFDETALRAPVVSVIDTFVMNGCYGGGLDKNPHTKKILALLDYDKPVKEFDALRTQFLVVENDIKIELSKYMQGKAEQARFEETRNAWKAYQNEFNKVALWKGKRAKHWKVTTPNLSAPADDKFKGKVFIMKHCPGNEVTGNCSLAVKEAVELFRGFDLLASIIKISQYPNAITLLNDTKLRLQQWDDYFNKAEPLWFLELGLNSILEMKGTRFDADNNLIGFRDVPDKQHLFLHPTVALQYFEDENSDSNLKPSVLLDLYGVNFLDWNKTTRRLDGSFGVSLITSYSNHENSDDFGWGFRFFNNKDWSLGITKNSERIGLFLSIGAVEQISDWRGKIDEWKASHEDLKEKLYLY
jgi:hypothetical protein